MDCAPAVSLKMSASQLTPASYKIKVYNCKLTDLGIRIELTRTINYATILKFSEKFEHPFSYVFIFSYMFPLIQLITGNVTKYVTKYKNMRKWIVEFLRNLRIMALKLLELLDSYHQIYQFTVIYFNCVRCWGPL